MPDDPTVSAVVALRVPPGEGETSATAVDERTLSKVKTHFSTSGFEVQAPIATTFSVAGKTSLFQEVFGVGVEVDEGRLPATFTVEGGGQELPLDRLPDGIRSLLDSVSFVPPPDLGSLGA